MPLISRSLSVCDRRLLSRDDNPPAFSNGRHILRLLTVAVGLAVVAIAVSSCGGRATASPRDVFVYNQAAHEWLVRMSSGDGARIAWFRVNSAGWSTLSGIPVGREGIVVQVVDSECRALPGSGVPMTTVEPVIISIQSNGEVTDSTGSASAPPAAPHAVLTSDPCQESPT